MVKRVAVIGAGATGLAALQHMKSRPEEFEPVAYEQMPVIGGTWVYTDDLVDNLGREVQSSMYKNLRYGVYRQLWHAYKCVIFCCIYLVICVSPLMKLSEVLSMFIHVLGFWLKCSVNS